MKPLERVDVDALSDELTIKAMLARDNKFWAHWLECKPEEVTLEKKQAALAYINRSREVWKNDVYTVFVRNHGEGGNGELIHLSIKRNDREPVIDWRDKQAIKNQLCGEESEGLELYPAESRVVDTSNQYHLWVFKGGKIPVGFPKGYKSEESVADSKQRPFNKEE
jgi:hypothetical protein